MTLQQAAPWLVWSWRIWSNLTGMAVIALGVGVGIVQAVSGDDAVLTATDVREETLRVQVGGRYGYVFDAERHEACPGEIVETFATANSVSPALVTLRRASVLMELKVYQDIRVNSPLPANVTPGVWNVSTSLVSHCANREQIDPIAQFQIEVVPQ